MAGSDKACAFTLPARLDTSATPALFAALRDRLGGDVVVDASAVECLGARALSVLLNARHHWERAGRDFVVINPSDAALADLACLGATREDLCTGGGA